MCKLKPLLFVILILLIGSLGCAENRQQIVQEEPIEKPMEESMQYRWVSAKAGLAVRNKPGASGEKIGAIPFGAEVLLLTEEENYVELAGRKGRWSKISWFGPDGWVFGGFLSSEDVTQEDQQTKE